jgi:uncharacterized protein (DUF305 family)
MTRQRRTRFLIVAVVAVIALAAVACNNDHNGMDMGDTMPMDGTMPMDDMGAMNQTVGTNPIPADAEYNAADLEFAQGMIVHHGQAVRMADMALANSSDPAVLDLAGEIKAAQEPEITQMTQWLESWGQPVPDPMMDHTTMDHGGMPMSGMTSQARMDDMRRTSGAEFDRMFLESMIEHHRGAIVMAQYALDNGRYPPLAALANDVIAVQRAEIAAMEGLLSQR